MNVTQNRFWLAISTGLMGISSVLFILYSDPAALWLLGISALANFYLRVRLFRSKKVEMAFR